MFTTRIAFYCCFLLLLSCEGKILSEKEKSTKELSDYLSENHKLTLSEKYSKVFILTHKNCHSCNQFFAKTIESSLTDSTCLFIVSASSSRIDLSEFLTAKNVYFEKNENINALFDNSKIFFLKKGIIDTTINIKIDNLESFPKELTKRK